MKQFNFEFIKNVVETAKVPEVSTRTIDFKENEIVVIDTNKQDNRQRLVSVFKFTDEGILENTTYRNQIGLCQDGKVFHILESVSSYSPNKEEMELITIERLGSNLQRFFAEEVVRIFQTDKVYPSVYYADQQPATVEAAKEFMGKIVDVLVSISAHSKDLHRTIFIEAKKGKVSVFVSEDGENFESIFEAKEVEDAVETFKCYVNDKTSFNKEEFIRREIESVLPDRLALINSVESLRIGKMGFSLDRTIEENQISLVVTMSKQDVEDCSMRSDTEILPIKTGTNYQFLEELRQLPLRLSRSNVIKTMRNEDTLLRTNETVAEYLEGVCLKTLCSREVQWVERVKQLDGNSRDFCGFKLLNHLYLQVIKYADGVRLYVTYSDHLRRKVISQFVANTREEFLEIVKTVVSYFNVPEHYKGKQVICDDDGTIGVICDEEFSILFSFDGLLYSSTGCVVSYLGNEGIILSKSAYLNFDGKFTDLIDEVLNDEVTMKLRTAYGLTVEAFSMVGEDNEDTIVTVG